MEWLSKSGKDCESRVMDSSDRTAPGQDVAVPDPTAHGSQKTMKGWILVLTMVFVFVLWGLFVFLVVGDKGPPPWDFGVIRDVPGESPYSTERH